MSILSKGLKFVPNSNSHSWNKQLSTDLYTFRRRILLHTFFRNLPTTAHSKFSLKSTWCPPSHILDPNIHSAFIIAVNESKLLDHFSATHNTTVDEKEAINSLRSNPNIIINKADKGNNIVLQN